VDRPAEVEDKRERAIQISQRAADHADAGTRARLDYGTRWAMSINRLMLLQQACAPVSEPDAPDWLLQMLREVMTAVAQEEGDTLKKAAMIARLGALYLRASGAAELKRANKELARRCTQLEEQLAALESAGAAETARPPAQQRNERIRPARELSVPSPSIATPGEIETAPVALEPDAPPIRVNGPAESRPRAAPAR
jgi:hypothetical protein